jgi:hypothetical protein
MPRNVQPATERDGLVTSIKVQKPSAIVKSNGLSDLLSATDNELLGWIETSIDALYQLEELFKAIATSAEDRRHTNPAVVLSRISKLAALGAYVATDIANGADCGRERFQELAAPFRAAAGAA